MIVPWLLLAVLAVGRSEPTPEPSVEPSTTTDLLEEGQDQVAILKQINRVNEDGSYTFGYEAADGSFKIETRDVAGNVKGMFGFVDEAGELKRVSYSASNGTGFQSTGAPNVPPLVTPSDMESTTRINLLSSSTTTENPDLPIYIYKSTTSSPRPEVIQHIPRLRPTPATATTEPQEVAITRRPPYSYLPKKSSTPNYITLKSTTIAPDASTSPVIQVIRPRGYKKVLITKRPFESSTTTEPTILIPTTISSSTYLQNLQNEDSDTNQREVESNSLGEAGLTASGTEDNPDVFGGPTARPYPASVYRNLFPQVPQYQRILQSPYLQSRNPYSPQPQDPRYSAAPYSPQLNNGFPDANRPYLSPGLQSRFQENFAGRSDPSFYRQQGPYSQVGAFGGNPYSQVPQGVPYNQVPPGVSPQPVGPPFPQAPQQTPGRGLYPVPPNIPPATRIPGQTLPTPGYNPTQGLLPTDARQPDQTIPKPNEVGPGGTASPPPPPPLPPPYQNGPPNLPQPGPEQGNRQSFLMEQLLRMFLGTQDRSSQISPFQQALLSNLGEGNVPPEFLRPNYDPRYPYPNLPPYPQYQQRNPYYPPPGYNQPYYDPRYYPYNNQPPYPGYYDPYSSVPGGYPYQNRSPYNPYYQYNPYRGYNPNPYQPTPEEVLFRMFLGARVNTPIPQAPSAQVQNSPTPYEGAPTTPQPTDVDSVFGQRLPPGNLAERSSPSSPFSRATARRSKGSRNVQIVEDSTPSEPTSTTAKPE